MKIKIAPSILSADFGKLNEEIASIESFSDMVHVDVMDGHFVSNLTFGAPVVRCIITRLPLDVHLMIDNPREMVEDFAKAIIEAGLSVGLDGVHKDSCITFHSEVVSDMAGLVGRIHEMGIKAGVSVKPGTDIHVLENVLDDLDLVLVMTVEPGFGGQKFMDDMTSKIEWLREKRPDLDIAVDGGINVETALVVREAGANVLVAGSYIFGAEDREKAVESLRG